MKQIVSIFILLMLTTTAIATAIATAFAAALGTAHATSHTLEFTLHKLASAQKGHTLLVIGGIQGDEPGGFNAASLLVTHYRITKGNVWIVPSLNFISIIKSSRGIYGDLNRKFASVSSQDPEYPAVKKIKSIIRDKAVDIVLNLHDGSGFYRHEYVDKWHNPKRWGQSIIIDQCQLDALRFGHLEAIANTVAASVNQHLLSDEHSYRVKNTKTRDGNTEMAKTLTYFAARHRKPAFGVEASKSFPTRKRTYYHLQAIEAFMQLMDIEFERKFALTSSGVKNAIEKNVKITLYDRKIFLDVHNARKMLRYVPLKKNANIEFTPSNPLIAIVNVGKNYRVFHGNRRITHLHPQYFDYDSSIEGIYILVDGDEKKVGFGQVVAVENSFSVVPRDGYRINVIGFRKKGKKNEAGITIRRKDIQKRFSIDQTGWIYRVEVYRKNKFTGMVLVNFNKTLDHLHAFNQITRNPIYLAPRSLESLTP